MEGLAKSKRKLANHSTAQPSVKKQKTGSVQKKSSKAKVKGRIAADKLRWQSSKLPDMFGDAEGFFGLEEVEGVEVVKNADNTIEFRASKTEAEDGKSESDEFQGFDDLPEEPTEPAKKLAKSRAPKEAEKGSEKNRGEPRPKKMKRATKSTDDPELESNVFTALEDIDDADNETDLSAWVSLELSSRLMSSLAKLRFSKPTPIQAAAIPQVLAGHDVIGKASTGSGKTLAFGIPIVEKWLETTEDDEESPESKGPVALILSPTRELAHQLTEHIQKLCSGLPTSPYLCSVTGGLSVQKQQRQISSADIVVGTPGRLAEVLGASAELMAKFRNVRFLVVDEADRLLAEGHFKEAEEIFTALDRVEQDEDEEEQAPVPRQTLVFSATFHKGLQQKLAGKGKYGLLKQEDSMEYLLKKLNFREEKPKFIDVNPVSQMAEGLKEGLVECGAMEKDLYLYTLLLLYPNAHTLVFTNSISAARRITPMLQNLNLPANPLHSQMAQKARLRSIERFTGAAVGKASVLIATDVAARGLDIPGVDLVVHYHVPRAADAYVHRSGRTARADRTGLSILLCSPDEVTPTRRLIAKVHSQSKGVGKAYFVQTLDVDRKLASRLKPRITLAKKIADANLAKEKGSKDDDWMRNAAEELGVDYDSEEMETVGKWGGRGRGRKEKQKEAATMSKAELGALRAELRDLLSKRVNAGVSEKYLATGMVDMDELLRGAKGEFLGKVEGLDFSSF